MSSNENDTYRRQLIELIDKNMENVHDKDIRARLEDIRSQIGQDNNSFTQKDYERHRDSIEFHLQMDSKNVSLRNEVVSLRNANVSLSNENVLLSNENVSLSNEKVSLSYANVSLSNENVLLKQINRNRSLARVKEEFPVLSDTTRSGPYYPKNHAHADVTSREVTMNVECLDRLLPDFWNTEFIQDSRSCNCEIDSQHLIFELLQSVLKGMKVSHLVEVVQNRTLAGAECDIVLSYIPNRLPFSAIEAKKPGASMNERKSVFQGKILKDNKVENRTAGEVFDEMKAIELFGFSTVTGMISTGNHWRLVGLMASNEGSGESIQPIHLEAELKKFQEFLKDQNSKLEDSSLANADLIAEIECESPEGKEVVLQRQDGLEDVKRNIWGGEIIPSFENTRTKDEVEKKVKNSGEEIVIALVLFVARSISNLSDFLKENSGNAPGKVIVRQTMPCRILAKPTNSPHDVQEGVFAFGRTPKMTNLDLRNYCLEGDEIRVIRHLGMGDYGNVCLGVSLAGRRSCVIKFYHKKEYRKIFAETECANWGRLYGKLRHIPKPFVREVAGGHCLIMPYLYPIKTKQDRQAALDGGYIRTVLIFFWNAGVIHIDMKWRHFRRYFPRMGTTDTGGQILLVDLGEDSLEQVTEDMNQNDMESWIETSIETLRKRIEGDEPILDDVTARHQANAKNEESNKKHKTK